MSPVGTILASVSADTINVRTWQVEIVEVAQGALRKRGDGEVHIITS